MNDDIGTLIEPQPVQFTWGAPGWYVLAASLLLAIAGIVLMIIRHYRKNRYRREAIDWLARRESEMTGQRPDLIVYDATMLVKRIVMTRYGREHSATRKDEWIAFLNEACKAQLFSTADGDWLTQTLYAGGQDIRKEDVTSYLDKTKTWIKRHRYAL
ncbi:DUF4381 domain-containing protein [Chryseolinea sp. T2]|uniref:DUF4381 domain-containing protein n=1 Tax=Chryseolinea sp. T2 TaxID=3129255 RepID=UPI0030789408